MFKVVESPSDLKEFLKEAMNEVQKLKAENLAKGGKVKLTDEDDEQEEDDDDDDDTEVKAPPKSRRPKQPVGRDE